MKFSEVGHSGNNGKNEIMEPPIMERMKINAVINDEYIYFVCVINDTLQLDY